MRSSDQMTRKSDEKGNLRVSLKKGFKGEGRWKSDVVAR
jgi:hypothetical protein